MKNQIKTAVFPVAGLGTRFLPATKVLAKEMLVVLDRPVIEWAVLEAFNSGIEKIIFVTSSKKNILLEHFDKSPNLENILRKKKKIKELKLIQTQSKMVKVYTVLQHEPKGLGHAIWCAKDLINEEKFAVILPDDVILSKKPVLKQLIDASYKTGGSILGIESVKKTETHKYGILDVKNKSEKFLEIKNIIEKPDPVDAPSNLSVIGRYILDSKIFDFLDKQKKGVGGEIQLTDAIHYLIGKKPIFGLKFDGKRFDCGGKLGYIKANINFALNDTEINKSLIKYIKDI